MAVMLVRYGARTAARVALVTAAAAFLLVFGFGVGSDTIGQRLASITSSFSQPDQSVSDRYSLWETAGAMWTHHPLTGVGPRRFAELRDTYAPTGLSSGSDTDDPVNGFTRQPLLSPHNMYLLVLSEQGVLGLAAFAFFFGALLVWTFRRSGVAVRRAADLAGRRLRLLRHRGRAHPGHGRDAGSRSDLGHERVAAMTTAAPAGLRAASLTAVLVGLGSMLGFGRDLLLARTFGADSATDAFLVAWMIPETLRAPAHRGHGLPDGAAVQQGRRASRRRQEPGRGDAAAHERRAARPDRADRRGAPWLVALLAPGIADPELAVRCMRLTSVTILMFGMAGYLSAALRTHHAFGPPAAISVAYNLGIIAVLWVFQDHGVSAAAAGVALGAVGMVLIQAPAFVKRLGRPRRPTRRMLLPLGAFLPIAAYTLERQGQVFVERFAGSSLAEGSISHLNYAQKIAQVPMILSLIVAHGHLPPPRAGHHGRRRPHRQAQADRRPGDGGGDRAARHRGAGGVRAGDRQAAAAARRVHRRRHRGHGPDHARLLARSARPGGRRRRVQGVLLRHPPDLVSGAGDGRRAGHDDRAGHQPPWGTTGIAAANAAGITLSAAILFAGLRGPAIGLSVRSVARPGRLPAPGRRARRHGRMGHSFAAGGPAACGRPGADRGRHRGGCSAPPRHSREQRRSPQ
ncbi:hypothetical protein GCM10020219_009900 [Nonomuraea dietziae]